jgi:hypothetical protein
MKLFAMVLAIIFNSAAYSAEFEVGEKTGGIFITGTINKGDFSRFLKFLDEKNQYGLLRNILLDDSNGGDVSEALKFANLFEKFFSKTTVMGKCYSACFVIWAGAVHRSIIGPGELGIHRLSLPGATSDYSRAKSVLTPASKNINQYLLDQGIPQDLLNIMNETPASSIFKINYDLAKDKGWLKKILFQPIFMDMLEKRCGDYPDPYMGEYVAYRPRSEEVMQKMTGWADCERNVIKQNRDEFWNEQIKLDKQGKKTILFSFDQ